MCAGALWLSRVEKVVYGCPDYRSGFLGSVYNLTEATELNHQYQVQSGVLEDECREMLQNFFRRIRREKKKKKMET